jgi:hypothetical protein
MDEQFENVVCIPVHTSSPLLPFLIFSLHHLLTHLVFAFHSFLFNALSFAIHSHYSMETAVCRLPVILLLNLVAGFQILFCVICGTVDHTFYLEHDLLLVLVTHTLLGLLLTLQLPPSQLFL